MKILIPKYYWIGGLIDNISTSFKKLGFEVLEIPYSTKEKSILKNPLNQLKSINKYSEQKKIEKYNRKIVKISKEFKPDITFVLNSGKLTPDTVKYLKEDINCNLVSFLPDNPFDSSRSKFTAMNLPYFDFILSCDDVWIQNIKNIAPNASVHKVIVGYNQNDFFPVDKDNIIQKEIENFSCDVSFTGAGYSELAEGAYRSLILNHISEYNLKIWSNDDWSFRFKYYPKLKDKFIGKRLSYEELRTLYLLSTINLNMPSPQIITTFQSRTFEIAACKGFQIIDYRLDVNKFFNSDALVSFNGIEDLKEKINYFINNRDSRMSYINNLYNKVVTKHTWDIRIKEYLDLIKY